MNINKYNTEDDVLTLQGKPFNQVNDALLNAGYCRAGVLSSKITRSATVTYAKRIEYVRYVVKVTHGWVSSDNSFGVAKPGKVSSATLSIER